MENNNFDKLETEIYKAIAECRTRVLDISELELGQNQQWALFRKQLLKHFGNRGLEAEVFRLFRFNGLQSPKGGFCA